MLKHGESDSKVLCPGILCCELFPPVKTAAAYNYTCCKDIFVLSVSRWGLSGTYCPCLGLFLQLPGIPVKRAIEPLSIEITTFSWFAISIAIFYACYLPLRFYLDELSIWAAVEYEGESCSLEVEDNSNKKMRYHWQL
jgi:hypothetical protein